MNGSFFLGELPPWLAETEVGSKSTTNKWVEKNSLAMVSVWM
ncbi:hypothetical protein SLEP1_g14233 [Rubroshorea leprosula]|uniref:Uncharacterized protein n=1 Tax=Rubroshorea leprosula TaxID=152421 RepID=A0AAV5ITU9_9ROSI|nr:hypothetical protein SLEP1_g14233 [Rubroshorea leprosula]